MQNKFLEKIDRETIKELPVSINFVHSQIEARQEEHTIEGPLPVSLIDIEAFNAKCIPYGFYRPLSMIL